MTEKIDVRTSSELVNVGQDNVPNSLYIVRKPPLKKPEFKKMEPSPLLSKVKNFLPQIKRSNEELLEAIAKEGDNKRFNIEEIEDTDENLIEMKLSLIPVDNDDSSDDSSSSDEEANTYHVNQVKDVMENLKDVEEDSILITKQNSKSPKIEILN